MVHGSTIYSKVKSTVKQLEDQHQDLTQEIYTVENNIERTNLQRENAFIELASTYLPELSAQSLAETLRRLRTEVEDVFHERQERRQDVEVEMQQVQEKRHTLEEKLATVSTELAEKGQRRDTLRVAVDLELAVDDEFVDETQKAEGVQKFVELYERRSAEVRSERDQKLPEYDQNKLFAYLRNRQFGTSKAKGSSLTKWFDARVAKLIDYSEQKRNYDELKSLPEKVDELLSAQRSQLEGIVKNIDRIRKAAEDEAGYTAVIAEGERLYERRAQVVGDIEHADRRYAALEKEREDIDNTKGSYHRKALDELRTFLKGQSLIDLKKQARTTPSSRDDELIAVIEDAEARIKEYRIQAEDLKQEQRMAASRLEGARRVQTTFSKKDWDGSRSRFKSGFDVDDMLASYLLGRLTDDDLISTAKKHQYFEAPESTYSSASYSSRSSSSSSSWGGGGHSSGGGFGGGGFSSGGGFGGGGFSTGGGF